MQVYAGDLPFGVGDRLRVDGELTRPEVGEDGFDYGRYLGTSSETKTAEAAKDLWHLAGGLLRKVLSHTVAFLLNHRAGNRPLQLSQLLN